jgi:hypothetical protein
MESEGKKTGFGWVVKLIILIIILAAVYGGWKYFGQKNNGQAIPNQTQNQAGSEQNVSQAEVEKATQELLVKVGKLIILPDEKPNFATVLDAKKLIAEQSFYAGSENGDQLLIYPKAQKAIIYSPSRNILVNVGPVYFDNATATPQSGKK